MRAHSPEPWSLEQVTFDNLNVRIRGASYALKDAAGREIGAIMSTAEAKRVVACVNFCRGVATEDLRQFTAKIDNGTAVVGILPAPDPLAPEIINV